MTSAESHLAVADAETDTPATASFREYMQLGRAAQSRGDYAAARDYFLQAAKVADVGRSR